MFILPDTTFIEGTTIMGVVLAWVVFRVDKTQKRKSLLVALNSEFKLLERWFGTSYEGNRAIKDWFNPFFMVIDFSRFRVTQNVLSSSDLALLSQDLIDKISLFNLGINRAQLHIERHQSFITSSHLTLEAHREVDADCQDNSVSWSDVHEKVKSSIENGRPYKREVGKYLETVYGLARAIHVDGISGEGYYQDKVAKPHQAFKLAQKALEKDLNTCWPDARNPLWYFPIIDIVALLFFLISMKVILPVLAGMIGAILS